mgnify:CR=1 FL=1
MLTGCKKESQGPDEYRNTDEHRRAIITEPTEEPREKSIKDNVMAADEDLARKQGLEETRSNPKKILINVLHREKDLTIKADRTKADGRRMGIG